MACFKTCTLAARPEAEFPVTFLVTITVLRVFLSPISSVLNILHSISNALLAGKSSAGITTGVVQPAVGGVTRVVQPSAPGGTTAVAHPVTKPTSAAVKDESAENPFTKSILDEVGLFTLRL